MAKAKAREYVWPVHRLWRLNYRVEVRVAGGTPKLGPQEVLLYVRIRSTNSRGNNHKPPAPARTPSRPVGLIRQ